MAASWSCYAWLRNRVLAMSPETAQKYLQREVGDDKIRVRWRNDIERFEVGRKTDSHIEWFYVVTDGESNFRPVDMRTVRKVISLDTWRRPKHSFQSFLTQLKDRKLNDQEKDREMMRYRLKHEARYIKKAAEQDRII